MSSRARAQELLASEERRLYAELMREMRLFREGKGPRPGTESFHRWQQALTLRVQGPPSDQLEYNLVVFP